MLWIPLSRVTGYLRFPGEVSTPNYSLLTHTPHQTGRRLQPLHCLFDLARSAFAILPHSCVFS